MSSKLVNEIPTIPALESATRRAIGKRILWLKGFSDGGSGVLTLFYFPLILRAFCGRINRGEIRQRYFRVSSIGQKSSADKQRAN
jgi:hypothetical protein